MPKDIRLIGTHHFIMKIPNKRELKKTAPQNSSDIDFQYMNVYINRTKKLHSFVVINNTLASDNLLRFRNNLIERI